MMLVVVVPAGSSRGIALATEHSDPDDATLSSQNWTTLHNGVRIPRVGLGTAGRLGSESVAAAFAEGVRLFDTARAKEWYDEGAVARALEDPRDRAASIVVTKLHPRDHGYHACRAAIEDSASRFGGYVDVFLLHYPRCWDGLCGAGWQQRVEGTWLDSYNAARQALADGLVRAVGVSNVGVGDLRELLSENSEKNDRAVVPHVVQNWMDPFHQDREVRAFCAARGVQYMAYSTLGTQWLMAAAQGRRENPVAASRELRAIAESRGATPVAVALAWAVQRGAVVVPRSSRVEHIRANAEVLRLVLTDAELEAVDALDGTLDRNTAETVAATFVADERAELFWVSDDAKLAKVADLDPAAGPVRITTYRGHVFRAVSSVNGDTVPPPTTTFTVTAAPGAEQIFHLRKRERRRSPTTDADDHAAQDSSEDEEL